MPKAFIYNILLVLLIAIENLFLLFAYQAGITSQTVNSMICFLSSVLIGGVVLLKFYNYPNISIAPPARTGSRYFVMLFMVGGLIFLNMITISLLQKYDPAIFSDIIPTVQLLAKRFIEGLYPYTHGAFISIGQLGSPSYFPMHWLPYTLSEHFHFDPRTVTFSIWVIGTVAVTYRGLRSNTLWQQILIPVLLLGSYYGLVSTNYGIICATIETMVAGYYMLFIVGLNQKNVYWTAFFISVCLLSRYFVVLWLPLWAFVMLASGNWRDLLKTSIAITIFISLLFVIPFLSKDWSFLWSSLAGYGECGFGEWIHFNDADKPFHLYAGTGFAHLFFENSPPTYFYAGYSLLRTMMFIVPLAVTLLMGVWYWFNRKKIYYKIFLLASFKIYLSVFVAFLIVPYLYLSVSGLFVSIAILAEQGRYTHRN